MGTIARASGLGGAAAASALVALWTFFTPDFVQHDGRWRSLGGKLPAPTPGVFAGRGHALPFPCWLDSGPSGEPFDGPPFLAHADVYPLCARNGTLPLRPLLSRASDAAIVHPLSISQPVWDSRSLHSHSKPDPFARRALRYRGRRAACRIHSGWFRSHIRAVTLAPYRRAASAIPSTGLSARLRLGCTPAARCRAALRARAPSNC